MFHRFYINLVVMLVRSDPFDEYDLVTIVDGHHQSVIVSFNVEDQSVQKDRLTLE